MKKIIVVLFLFLNLNSCDHIKRVYKSQECSSCRGGLMYAGLATYMGWVSVKACGATLGILNGVDRVHPILDCCACCSMSCGAAFGCGLSLFTGRNAAFLFYEAVRGWSNFRIMSRWLDDKLWNLKKGGVGMQAVPLIPAQDLDPGV